MTPHRWQEINDLFNVVVELDTAGRQQKLEEIRALDPELCDHVEALLLQTAASFEIVPQRHDPTEPAKMPTEGVLNGRYRLQRELGHGGFGVVYLALDERLHQKPVVVKLLAGPAPGDEWFRKKFQDEIKALARIDHPGVVGIIDVGQTPEGTPFIVMQYVDGITLRALIASGRIEVERIARIVQQIGQALVAAHARGVLHRDLKPENVMLQPSSGGEIVRLIDFGIATIRETDLENTVDPTRVAGSLAYMAPEQFRGQPSAASDIFAMGVISCEMLSGRSPRGQTSEQKLDEVCERRPGLSTSTIAMLRKALAADPEERFQDAGIFGDALASGLAGMAGVAGRSSRAVGVGSVLSGRYHLRREIGRGGFGVVYLAHDQQLHDRPVVVKLLLTTSAEDAWRYKKFQDEISALSRINHPNIVLVTDAGEAADGHPYLVMEYVEGSSLRALLRDDGVELKQVGSIIRETGLAVAAAHECGVWHRDLKPENILIQTVDAGEFRVKVIDFGIASVGAAGGLLETTDTRVAGSFRYMSPEQLMGRPEAASDVYALGAIAYECITGKRPFRAQTAAELYTQQAANAVEKPRRLRPELSERAEQLLLQALAFEPGERPPSAKEFGHELSSALEEEPISNQGTAADADDSSPSRNKLSEYDVFVCHASRDLDFGYGLVRALEGRGARCFIAPRDVPPGETFPLALGTAIGGSRSFLLVLTEDAITSVQVAREVELAQAAGKPVLALRIDEVEPAGTLAIFLTHPVYINCSLVPTPKDLKEIERAIRVHVPSFSGPGVPQPEPQSSEDPSEPLLSEFRPGLLPGQPGRRQVSLIAFFSLWALMTCVLSLLANAGDITVVIAGPDSPHLIPVRFGYLYELNGAFAYLLVVPWFLYFAMGFVQKAQSGLVSLASRDQIVVNQAESQAGFLARLRTRRNATPERRREAARTPVRLIAEANRRWMNRVILGLTVAITLLLIVGTEYLPPKSDYKHVMFGYVQAPWIADYPALCPNCTLSDLQQRLGRRIEPLGRLSVDQLASYRIVEPYYRRTGSRLERTATVLFMISTLGLQVSVGVFVVWTLLKAFFVLQLIYRAIVPSKTSLLELHLRYTDPAKMFGLEPLHRALMQLVALSGISVILEVLSWWTNILKGSMRRLGENLDTLGGWGQFMVANFSFVLALMLLIYLFFMSGKAREAANEEVKRIAAAPRRGSAGKGVSAESLFDLIADQSVWRDPRYTIAYVFSPLVYVMSLLILNQNSIAASVGGLWEMLLKHILGKE